MWQGVTLARLQRLAPKKHRKIFLYQHLGCKGVMSTHFPWEFWVGNVGNFQSCKSGGKIIWSCCHGLLLTDRILHHFTSNRTPCLLNSVVQVFDHTHCQFEKEPNTLKHIISWCGCIFCFEQLNIFENIVKKKLFPQHSAYLPPSDSQMCKKIYIYSNYQRW